MLLYRNINPALKCELPKGPKKSDCLGRTDAGRASEERELSFPGPGNCGIAADHTHPWSSVTFPLPPGSRAGVNGHTQPVPVQGAAIPGYPGTSSGIALAPRAPHGAPHTDTGTRLRPLPQSGEAEFLEALSETEGQRQGWECRDEAAGAAGMGSCSPGLGICPGTRSPWMHKQPGRERDEAGREQGLAALGVKGN